MGTQLLLVDDQALVRRGLLSLLEGMSDLEIVGEADNGREAVELARQLSPDVVITDVDTPVLNGADAARQIRTECPGTSVIALSRRSDTLSVARMLKAGASAYLLKTCDLEELLHAIDVVVGGGTYLTPEVMGDVVEGYLSGTTPESLKTSGLSGREREVLQLLAEGKNSKQIARILGVSSRTVDSHRQRIMEKLGIHSVAELTKSAIRAGLTTVEC